MNIGISQGNSMHDYVIILMVIFVASTVRVIAGFGDALLGMPILLCFFSLEQADTIVATYGLLIGILLSKHFFPYFKKNYAELARLLIASALGVFLGAIALKTVNTDNLVMILGCVLIFYPVVYVFSKHLTAVSHWKFPSILAGLIGGFLGGAVNTNGPAFVIYGQMRKWSPVVFIAMFQPLFVMGNLFNLITYASLGVYAYRLAFMTLLAFPIVVLSYFIGNKVRDKIAHYFNGLVVAIIFASGLMILLVNFK
jgi:uncharacterized protein